MNKYLLSLALAAVGLLVTPGDSHAQRWGGSRGWGGSGVGVGISVGGPGYYGGYGSYGRGYPGYYNGGYGYSGWGYNPGYYSNWGSYPSYGYSYPSTSYYSYPNYSYSPTYSTPAYSSAIPANPTTTTSFYYSPRDNPAANLVDKAEIEVRLPANAELWLDGAPTTQRGAMRTFETPPLQVGQVFTYEFRARWMQDGQVKEDVRQVKAFAGAKEKVKFGN
jgi:uncharacterized protein (TIGR03000 family)